MDLGWLDGAKRILSPNFDDRPIGIDIDLLVIHCISLPPGEFNGRYVEAFFCNNLDSSLHPYFETISDLKVSSHLFIKRNGELIQFVPLLKRAWHAGVSIWQGREACNDFSIGIELEGCEDQEFTCKQYETLIEVTQNIQKAFPVISKERIVGHSDIAPERKTDPGPLFEWERYLKAI